MCSGIPFTVEKISPQAGNELSPLEPTELPGLLNSCSGKFAPCHHAKKSVYAIKRYICEVQMNGGTGLQNSGGIYARLPFPIHPF